jgi:hypothetical protein
MPRSKWSKFWQLTAIKKALLLEALLAIAFASVALRCVHFSKIAAWLSVKQSKFPATSDATQDELARSIGWSIRIAAFYVPWPAQCLVQALAATTVARWHRLSTVLYLGVKRSEIGELQAHAWLCRGDNVICGGPIHAEFRTVAIFGNAA